MQQRLQAGILLQLHRTFALEHDSNDPSHLQMVFRESETDVSNIRIDARGVIEWRYKEGATVDLEAGRREVRCIDGMMSELELGHSYLLIDIRDIKVIHREARRLFASEEISDGYGVRALALLIGSPLSRFIGNFWFAINRPKHPTRLFQSEEQAMTWLLQWIEVD